MSDQYNLSVKGAHNRNLIVWGHNPSSREGMVAVKWGSSSHCSLSADKGWWMLVFSMTSPFNSGMRPKPIKWHHPQSQINQEYIQDCLLKNATLYWTLVSFTESRIMLSAVTYIKPSLHSYLQGMFFTHFILKHFSICSSKMVRGLGIVRDKCQCSDA